jgi:hypothetical protein
LQQQSFNVQDLTPNQFKNGGYMCRRGCPSAGIIVLRLLLTMAAVME